MKRTARFVSLLVVTALLASSTTMVFAKDLKVIERDASSRPAYVEGELIVRYAGKATIFDKVKVREKNSLQKIKDLPSNMELVRLPAGLTTSKAKDKLTFDPDILSVQPNFLYYPDAVISNDPYAGIEWGLDNQGQEILGIAGTPDIDIDAPEAWKLMPASPDEVIVAVIDTGVDIDHPDLQGSIWMNEAEVNGLKNYDDDGNGYIDDFNGWNFFQRDNDVFTNAKADGHGTHVSGTIAAQTNNGIGVAGVAQNVKIMVLKFIGINGGSTADAILAVKYAKDNGADVANNSWGGGGYDQALKDAIEDFGKPFIAAAGNEAADNDLDAHYPSSYTSSNIISVASVDNTGLMSSFSNYGKTSVDVAAPGGYIASTYPDSSYAWMSGTSMAAPHVSGVVALMLGAKPGLSASQVKEIVLKSATSNKLSSLAGKILTGGMVNAEEAVKLALRVRVK
ncbi:S8 family peptidase [Youngiibacter multivorans]|uniref:Subtilisin family serine protease n=1 Tax=Youngiibacter multivorans TaxID=937251 RepID=A0ABS4G3M5_9CLOT|nr:S8 family peptidase [Youngiibacter multivorans]MBP1919136.1 subtilisin family serine protease [Youngiibacter multivorans]